MSSDENYQPAQLKYGEVLVIILGLAAFLSLTTWQLNLPGLHYDEAKEAGLPAMQILKGSPVGAFRDAAIRIGPLSFPLMVADYIGATNVYFALPFLALGGINVVSLRLLPISLSALSLVLLYLFAREAYNTQTAMFAFCLLAVNPSFIFWSRQGIFVTSTIIPISLAATLCLLRWYRQRRPLYLVIGAFLLGLGLYTKFIFVWFIMALIFTAWWLGLMWPRAMPSQRAGPLLPASPSEFAGAALAFGAGLFPLLVYNLQTGGTFGIISKNFLSSYYGTNNLDFLGNLATRLDQLRAVLEGSHLWYLGGIYTNPLWPYVCAILFIAGLIAAQTTARSNLGGFLFPWLIWLLMVPMSCFTISALWPTHYAILVPWPALAVAVGASTLMKVVHRWRPLPALIVASIVGLMLVDVRVDILYHSALARSGGLNGHTSASYHLADSLDRQRLTAPLAMDWGIAAPVEYLTQGRVHPIEVFGYDWNDNAGFKARVVPLLDNPDMVYIFHSPPETIFPRRDAFATLVNEKGMTTQINEVITAPDGRAIFLLVRALR